MTAIIVAAIPFPDAAADDGTMTYASGTDSLPYEYGVTPVAIENVVFDDSTDNTNVAATYSSTGTAYTISNISGDWQMDWQFKYYTAGDGADGYITKYNNSIR